MRAPTELRGAALLVALALLSCGPGAAPRPTAPAAKPDLVTLGRSIVDEVARLRGLAPKQPIELREAPSAEFERILEEDSVALEGEASRAAARTRATVTLAYYRRKDRVVYVRDRLPTWAEAAEVTPGDLLAHEITHALQDQHFGIFDEAGADADAVMARRSLVEGDAMLVQVGYHAAHEGRPIKRALSAVGAVEASASPQMLIKLGLFSPALLDAPPARQTALMFPYLYGQGFASALYRTGGFALVDRAHRAPPTVTAQILDPDAYVSGMRPTPIASFPVPRGFAVTTEGSFGAAATLGFLRTCGAAGDAELVRGWRGGRVLIAKAPPGVEVTVLVTAWANEERATAFESQVSRCSTRARTPGAPREEHVARSGERVALISGVRGDVTRLVEDAFATVGGAPAPAPPFGALALVPPPVPLGRRMDLHGSVVGDAYTSDWLSVRARVPPGFRANTNVAMVQLLVANANGAVGGFMIEGARNQKAAEQMHEAMAIGMQSTAGGGRGALAKLGSAAARTRLGAGTAVLWSLAFDAGVRRIRTVVVRACDGYAAYAWVQTWSGQDTSPELDAWLDSFEPTGAASAACRQIVEEATVDLP